MVPSNRKALKIALWITLCTSFVTLCDEHVIA